MKPKYIITKIKDKFHIKEYKETLFFNYYKSICVKHNNDSAQTTLKILYCDYFNQIIKKDINIKNIEEFLLYYGFKNIENNTWVFSNDDYYIKISLKDKCEISTNIKYTEIFYNMFKFNKMLLGSSTICNTGYLSNVNFDMLNSDLFEKAKTYNITEIIQKHNNADEMKFLKYE